MYYRFSKLAKAMIIINVAFTIFIFSIHCYNAYKIKVTNEAIEEVMNEERVIRETAIRILQERDVKLFLDREMETYFGIFMSILTVFMLYKYARYNGFVVGFFAAICCLFTSFFGGMLMFYLILSGKSESIGGSKKQKDLISKDAWEQFVHQRSKN